MTAATVIGTKTKALRLLCLLFLFLIVLSGCDGPKSGKKENSNSETESTQYAVDSVSDSSSCYAESSFNNAEIITDDIEENSFAASATPSVGEAAREEAENSVSENQENREESDLSDSEENDGVSFPIIDENSGVWDEN